MLFKRISPELPETVFVVAVNGTGGGTALIKDQAVCMDISSLADGVRVLQPTTAALWCGMGIVDHAIPDGGTGLVQIYGYRSSSIVFMTGTTQPAGAPLVMVNAANYLASQATQQASTVGNTQFPYVAALVGSAISSTASGTVSVPIFLKCLGF